MITVNDLVAARPGELTMTAGHGGGERIITWAHVCDLPDPWAWVRPGDLVMTTGDGLPTDPDTQGRWLSTLIDVGISALVLAPRPGVPRPSTAMSAVADERSVPLLTADFALKFVGLGRTVIESAVQSERDHINTARRLFDVYSGALLSRPDLAGRLDVVARSVGWAISVIHRDTGNVIAAAGSARGETPPITVPVPGRVPVDVRVQPDRPRVLDGSLVHYLAGLVGIELEHQAQASHEQQQRGEVVLRGVLEGTVSGAQLRHELLARRMGGHPVALAVIRSAAAHPGDQDDRDTLPPPFDVAPLTAAVEDDLVVLVPAGWPELEEFRRTLPPGPLGVSAPLSPGAGLREAFLQARTAAAHAEESGASTTFYDRLDDLAGISPRSISEMRRLVDRVLRPLIEHDSSSGGALLASLELFLRNDRSWTRTADALGIHRQTLIYRLGQVERLTGLKPTSSAGIATLWMALEAARTTGALDRRL